jgi:hypothetical protein
MASKRRKRRKSCSGKRRYESSADARTAMIQVIHAGRSRGGFLHVYRCRFCGGYHFGHAPFQRLFNGC